MINYKLKNSARFARVPFLHKFLARTLLESPQVLHRTNSNAVFSLFWLQLGQTKRPICMLAPAKPTISGFTASKLFYLPARLRGWGHWNPKLRGWEGVPPLQFSPYSIFWPKGSQKTINSFSHFHGLMPDNNYKHFKCFVILATHSKPCRGQMSHICDISPLRVKCLPADYKTNKVMVADCCWLSI